MSLNAKSEAAKKAQAAAGTGQSFALGGCERSGETDPYYLLFSYFQERDIEISLRYRWRGLNELIELMRATFIVFPSSHSLLVIRFIRTRTHVVSDNDEWRLL